MRHVSLLNDGLNSEIEKHSDLDLVKNNGLITYCLLIWFRIEFNLPSDIFVTDKEQPEYINVQIAAWSII